MSDKDIVVEVHRQSCKTVFAVVNLNSPSTTSDEYTKIYKELSNFVFYLMNTCESDFKSTVYKISASQMIAIFSSADIATVDKIDKEMHEVFTAIDA